MNNSLNPTHSKLFIQNLIYTNHQKYNPVKKLRRHLRLLNRTFVFGLLLLLLTAGFTKSAFAYPHAEIISMSPSHSNVGDTVTFTGHGGREQHGKIVSYEWFSSIDGAIGNGRTLKTNELSPGFHKIRLRVTNDKGITHSTKLRDTNALDTTQIISVSLNQPKGNNLIKNPGFENSLERNWFKQQSRIHKVKIVNRNVNTGTSALVFQRSEANDTNSRSKVYQYINITPGHTYQMSVSAAIKEKTTGFYSVVLRWFFISNQGRLIELANSRSIVANFDRNTNNYVNKTIQLTAPTHELNNAKIAVIYLKSMRANGVAYFDDIEMVDITETEHPLPEAHITHVSSSDAYVGETIELIGDTSFTNGAVTNYQWHSDIDGLLSTAESFQTNGLSISEHNISLRIKDESGLWSENALTKITVNERNNQPNLISNSMFSNEAPSWQYNQYYLPNPYWPIQGISIIRSRWSCCSYGININGDKNNYRSVFQKIENQILGGKTYRLSVNLSTSYVRTGKYFAQIRWYDDEGLELKESRSKVNIQSQRTYSSKSLRQFIDIAAPESAVTTSIHLVAAYADGRGRFGNISIHQID